MPRTVATTAEMAATRSDTYMASVRAPGANGSFQLSKVNSCQMMLNFPRGLLNEYATITTIGVKR